MLCIMCRPTLPAVAIFAAQLIVSKMNAELRKTKRRHPVFKYRSKKNCVNLLDREGAKGWPEAACTQDNKEKIRNQTKALGFRRKLDSWSLLLQTTPQIQTHFYEYKHNNNYTILYLYKDKDLPFLKAVGLLFKKSKEEPLHPKPFPQNHIELEITDNRHDKLLLNSL